MYILVVKVAESDSIFFFRPSTKYWALGLFLVCNISLYVLQGGIFGPIVCDEMGTKTWFQIEPPLVINAMQCIGLHRYFGLMLKCQWLKV